MRMESREDAGINGLLVQDGDRYFVDEKGELEVIFKARRVAATPERPHGLKYSLMLLNSKGQRLVCFDNAHSVSERSGRRRSRSKQYDHKHIGDVVSPYEYRDAFSLLECFWAEVQKHF